MRLLIIDYITYLGHRNFNKIHVESLIRLGHTIHVVGRNSALSSIDNNEKLKFTYLPGWSNRSFPVSSVSERLKNVALLFWIKRKFDFQDYDLVIFLAYDILSLCFHRSYTPTILINHNNVSQLGSRIKLYLTKHLSGNYTHVVLTEETRMQLRDLLGKDSVKYVPHGFVYDKGEAVKPKYLNEGERFIFCPINSNYNAEQVTNLFSSSGFLELLEKENLLLVTKSNLVGSVKFQHIVSLSKRIPEEEYRYLLRNAVAVILPYSNAFKYRCSGILFECISANTPVIATQIEALDMYRDLIQIKFFRNVSEFVDNIRYFLNTTRTKVDNTVFVPDNYWEQILNEI